jgi:hypothetical protein
VNQSGCAAQRGSSAGDPGRGTAPKPTARRARWGSLARPFERVHDPCDPGIEPLPHPQPHRSTQGRPDRRDCRAGRGRVSPGPPGSARPRPASRPRHAERSRHAEDLLPPRPLGVPARLALAMCLNIAGATPGGFASTVYLSVAGQTTIGPVALSAGSNRDLTNPLRTDWTVRVYGRGALHSGQCVRKSSKNTDPPGAAARRNERETTLHLSAISTRVGLSLPLVPRNGDPLAASASGDRRASPFQSSGACPGRPAGSGAPWPVWGGVDRP